MADEMKLVIFTDGASRGNPGEASYGFSITDSDGNLVYQQGKYLGINTNNFAEYSAVLAAYKYLVAEFSFDLPEEVTFYMDSKLVKEQLSGRYKIKAPNLIPLIQEIKSLEGNFKKFSYIHIPRAQNSVPDRLANEALDNRHI